MPSGYSLHAIGLQPACHRVTACAGWTPGDQPHKLTKLQIKLLGALHLTKPGQERMQREGWQLDSCPLLKPHELSASAVVNPQVTVEAYGGSFAAAGELLDACANGDVWTSHTKQRNGLNPMWNEHVEVGAYLRWRYLPWLYLLCRTVHVEVGISHPELAATLPPRCRHAAATLPPRCRYRWASRTPSSPCCASA